MSNTALDRKDYSADYTIFFYHDEFIESPRYDACTTIWSDARFVHMNSLGNYNRDDIYELIDSLAIWRLYTVEERAANVRFVRLFVDIDQATEMLWDDANRLMLIGADADTLTKHGYMTDDCPPDAKMLDQEVDDWEQYINGACYEFRIVDRNGDIAAGEGGHIGWDSVYDAAHEAARYLPPVEQLFTVRFTDEELVALAAAVKNPDLRDKVLASREKGHA